MSDDPREFTIGHDREGFLIEDQYGEDMCPTQRFISVADAKASLSAMVESWMNNYEPPDPPGWEGGFADNH